METPIEGGGAPAPSSDYVAEGSFDDLNLSEPVRRGVAERGYLKPTPVQAATYQPILAGRDVIVRSKTGTGKTAAFGIPMLERIPAGRRRPSALVMCPTRELALQVADEIAALGKHKDLSVVTVYGGASMSEQLDEAARRRRDRGGHAGPDLRPHPPRDAEAGRGDGERASTRPTRCSTWASSRR